MIGKKVFLKKITEQHQQIKSIEIKDTNFEGSSPPSVFIGRHSYPYVLAGPMLSQEEHSEIYDTPEGWLGNFNKEQIINFRLRLLRGKQKLSVHNLQHRFAEKLRDIALSKESPYAHAEFERIPRGVTFNEDHQPFGPSAPIKRIETDNTPWNPHMEKAYYDTDLLAKDAVLGLNKKSTGFTSIQKALSVGAFGRGKNRKLVPTRWSITATDDIIGKDAMTEVKENEVIDEYRVYESEGMHNYFGIMLTPDKWQYEAIEAFINILGKKTFTFSDYEGFRGRKEYSEMGGCYYAQRGVIAEHLKQNSEQASAFVFREAYEGYVPTGVWVCRELTRKALQTEPKTFKTQSEALSYINSKTRLGVGRLQKDMPLLQQSRRTLKYYF